MRKCITLLKTGIITLLVYVWFLGSSILIKIDSQQLAEEASLQKFLFKRKIFEEKMNNFSKIRSNYCTNEVSVSMKDVYKLARKEKAVRDNLIYIPELEQLWCLVPKAASTFWSHRILESLPEVAPKLKRDLHNASIPVQVSLRKHFGNIGTKVYNKIITADKIKKVLLVRHPFSRIVSAFEDKLKNRKLKKDSMFFYGHYGVRINRLFRKNKKANKKKEPTFEEFIDYLLETDVANYDEHWKPISELCGLCRIKYNHVIKQDHLHLGGNLSFHLKELEFLEPSAKDEISVENENKSRKEFEDVGSYFKNVSFDKMRQLYKKYEGDFKLFSYSV